MTPERWARIEEIVQTALDSAPVARSAIVEAGCGTDAELRREVESLLAADRDADFTARHGFDDALTLIEQHVARLDRGRTIGHYRILRELGRGGMGTVYEAARADDAFQKVVAIKVIRAGLDHDEIIQRFQSERQILAMLDHPNIARLLDAGSTGEGSPYFVMEYIEGEPIDRYAERHNLGVRQKLRLFQGVCAAVHYAHQHLIIHRDIKPGNVLVTTDGVPRLLDFGIAKLLGPGSLAETVTMLHPLTPEFASPEQIRGDPITTASDVYSLGVLLYALLTRQRPYRGSMTTPAEIEHAICEEEAQAPSLVAGGAAAREISGDLDNIVLMALRKDPRRRYSSVEQFSADIERWLANRPVAARRDTRAYRALKFVQRNKPWVAMAAITMVSLAGGIAASLWQTHVARQQRDLARREQIKAARINAFLQEMVGYSAVAAATGKHRYDATVSEMLDDAAERVETEWNDQPEVKAELLGTIGATYMNQVKIEPAGRFLREAYDLDMKLYGANHVQTAGVMVSLANLAYRRGDYAAAESWFDTALPVFRTHAKDADFEIPRMPAVLSDAAFVKMARGKSDVAEGLWREALSYGPSLPEKNRSMSITPKTFLAQLYMGRGDVDKADALASVASQELRALASDHFALAQSLIDLGNVRCMQKRYGECESLIQEGTRLYAEVQGETHMNVAYGLVSLGNAHCYEGKYDLAEQDAHKALEIFAKLKIPKGTNYYASADSVLGRVMIRTGRAHQAEPLLREALASREKSPRRNDVSAAMGLLGECLLAQKRYAEAEPLLVNSYEIMKATQVAQSPALKEARERLDSLYAAWGRNRP